MDVTCPRCKFRYSLEGAKGAPRTTGRGSQWNHVVGHAVQIGEEQGLTWREALIETCERAITKGYPYKTSKWGKVIPKDYKEMTMEEASMVIAQEHEDAVFLNVILNETKYKEES
jgi:hypothetical protein